MKYSKYRIEDHQIVFDFYEFYFSSMRKNKVLTLDRIKCVDFNNFPASMEIDDGEIIFFNHGDDENIMKFAEQHQITQCKTVDVWGLLVEEFLDTEIDAEVAEANQKKLMALGFSKDELRKTRKRINWTLFGTWEWQYLGHWNLLAMKQGRNPFYRLNGSDFYWWTMKIALRGKE